MRRAPAAQLQGAGDVERTILALAAARAPRGGARWRGSSGRRAATARSAGQANLTAFAILALRAAGVPAARLGAARAWLARQQNRDGGFGVRPSRGDPERHRRHRRARSRRSSRPAAPRAATLARGARATCARTRTATAASRSSRARARTRSRRRGRCRRSIAAGAARAGRARSRYLRARVTASGAVQYAAGDIADAGLGHGRGARRARRRAAAGCPHRPRSARGQRIWFGAMLVGVPTETAAGERRVALVPDVVRRLARARRRGARRRPAPAPAR